MTPTTPLQNEPQLSAEMEKRLLDLLPLGLDDWIVEDIKHFLATALEEQEEKHRERRTKWALKTARLEQEARANERAAVIAEIESWLVDEVNPDPKWNNEPCCTCPDCTQYHHNQLRAELRAKLVEMKGEV